jgi:hypothetical protein
MKKQYRLILLVLFAGLKMQAQSSSAMPADTTVHIGLNTYAYPMSLVPTTTALQKTTDTI